WSFPYAPRRSNEFQPVLEFGLQRGSTATQEWTARGEGTPTGLDECATLEPARRSMLATAVRSLSNFPPRRPTCRPWGTRPQLHSLSALTGIVMSQLHTRTPNRFVPKLESLDDRIVPSCTWTLDGGVLTILGSQGADEVDIQDDGTNLTVTCD